jgi:uncharacterized protein
VAYRIQVSNADLLNCPRTRFAAPQLCFATFARRQYPELVMPISKLTVELSIPHAHSIKDRRQVVRSIKDKLRHGFNVSVAELDDANLWNRATLGVVALSASATYLAGQMQEVDNAIHRLAASLSAEVLESYVEDVND